MKKLVILISTLLSLNAFSQSDVNHSCSGEGFAIRSQSHAMGPDGVYSQYKTYNSNLINIQIECEDGNCVANIFRGNNNISKVPDVIDACLISKKFLFLKFKDGSITMMSI